ncbi:MAG TPA: HD domain-containing protein [Herpetosiphonaceae bacterium]
MSGERATMILQGVREDVARQQPRAGATLPDDGYMLLAALSNYDRPTYLHSLRVGKLAAEIARVAGLDREECWLAGLLHDCGKLLTPLSVLRKAGHLSGEEIAIVRRHAAEGATLIRRYPALADLSPIIADHHERPDGAGYPTGSTWSTPSARAVALANQLDALTYHPNLHTMVMEQPAAIKETLRREAGRAWDEDLALKVAANWHRLAESAQQEALACVAARRGQPEPIEPDYAEAAARALSVGQL